MCVKYFVCTVSVPAIVLYLGGQTGSICPVSSGLQLRHVGGMCPHGLCMQGGLGGRRGF